VWPRADLSSRAPIRLRVSGSRRRAEVARVGLEPTRVGPASAARNFSEVV